MKINSTKRACNPFHLSFYVQRGILTFARAKNTLLNFQLLCPNEKYNWSRYAWNARFHEQWRNICHDPMNKRAASSDVYYRSTWCLKRQISREITRTTFYGDSWCSETSVARFFFLHFASFNCNKGFCCKFPSTRVFFQQSVSQVGCMCFGLIA